MVEYRPIRGHEKYEAGDDGSVWSLDFNGTGERRILNGSMNGRGYRQVTLSGVKYRVNRVVLESFIGPCPSGMECCHEDGDRANNRLDNLRWGSRTENAKDRVRHGTVLIGEKNRSAKLNEPQVLLIRRLSRAGGPLTVLAKLFGVAPATISNVVRRRNWTHV